MNAEAVAALLETLRTAPDASARAQAAIDLGRSRDPAVALWLLDVVAVESDPVVRGCIVNAVGFLDNRAVVPALLAIVADTTETPSFRGEAAEAIGHLDAAEAASDLIAALDDPTPDVRFWSAFALGRLGAEDALPALRRLAASDQAVVPNWWSVAEEARSAIASIEAAPSCPTE